jgi:hypothetical protein
VVTAVRSATVEFSGLGHRSGPLTHGQQYIWRSLRLKAVDDQPNPVVAVRLHGDVRLSAVADAVTALMSAYESLRTRLATGADGSVQQVVVGAGALRIDLFEDAEADACDERELAFRWGGTGFDHFTDFPLRVNVVARDGRIRWLVVTVSHLAADMHGLDIVIGFLLRALSGETAEVLRSVTGRHPLDQAAYEVSATGRRRAQRSLDFWEQQLRRFPRFTLSARSPSTPRYWRGLLTSPAMAQAVPVLAERSGVSPSAVVLAALALSFRGRDTGDYAMTVVYGNRHAPELAGSVMNLPQRVPVVVSPDPHGFAATARSAHAQALRAYRHAQYPPDALAALIREVSAERGCELSVPTFNSHVDNDAWAQAELGLTADGLMGLTARTTFRWTERFPDDIEKVRFVDLYEPDTISLYADTCYVTPEENERLLRETERILVDAALDARPEARRP